MEVSDVLTFCRAQIAQLDREYEFENLPADDYWPVLGAFMQVIRHIEAAEFDPSDLAGACYRAYPIQKIKAIKMYRDHYLREHGFLPGLLDSKNAIDRAEKAARNAA